MKNHAPGVFLFGLVTMVSMTLLYGADVGKSWIEVSGSTAKEYEVPIRAVQTEEPKTALTFNASWPEDGIREILDALNSGGMKAAFFVAEEWAESHPEELREMAESGHELGILGDGQKTKEELTEEKERLEELAGKEIWLYRSEEEICSRETIRAAGDCGLRTVGWSLDSLDWKEYGADAIIRQISENLESGSIILCRTDGGHTAEALAGMDKMLAARGFETVTLSGLLGGGEGYIDRDGTWIPA